MLADRRVHVTLPVADLDRARAFYEDKLGFTPYSVQPTAVIFQAGDGSMVALSRGSAVSSGTHTQMAFTSHDLEADVADARSHGVVFEEYDFPGLKTIDGIGPVGPNRAAWFKDSEGNLIGIVEFADASV